MDANLDPDSREIRQNLHKAVKAVEQQIKLLALRLLNSGVRMNELEAERQNARKNNPI
jgi:hypothetical protein